MQALLFKLIFNAVIKAVNKKYNMSSINNYVHNDNELDVKVRAVYKRIVDLEEDSHPPVFKTNDYKKLLKRIKKL